MNDGGMKGWVLLVVLWAGRTRGCAPAPGCSCVTGDLITYSCGGLELKTRDDGYIEVDCGGRELNCSVLPQIKVGKKDTLERVEITSCSLPPELSLTCVLRAVGASAAKVLAVQLGASGVSERNVEGMQVVALNMRYDGGFHPTAVPLAALSSLASVRSSRFVHGENVTLFANMFANASRHFQYLEIGSSGVREIPDDAFFGLARLVTLNLWGNEIEHISQHAFRGLSSLKKLFLNNNPVHSVGRGCLAHSPHLRTLYLERSRLTEIEDGALAGLSEIQEIKIQSDVVLNLRAKAFSNLPNLTSLIVQQSRVPTLPSDLFHNSTALVNLTLALNDISVIPEDVFADLRMLKDLDLSRNQIKTVSKQMFRDLVALTSLNLDGNFIQMLPKQLFSGLTALQSVRLSNNSIHYISLDAFSGAEYITHLYLSRNLLSWSSDDGIGDNSPMNRLTGLQTLDLSHNNISVVMSDWRVVLPLWSLSRLDLSHNAFASLSPADVNILGRYNGEILEVDFRYNHIALVHPSPFWEDAGPPPNNVRILLDDNPFNCNCLLFDFINALQDKSFKYNVVEAACHSPISLQNESLLRIPVRDLACPLNVTSEGDSCLFRPKYRRTECDFNQYIYNLTVLPDPSELRLNNMSLRLRIAPSEFKFPAFVRELILSNVSLRNIPTIPETVESLDLTGNEIGVVPEYLFRDNLTLYLAGNPIVCECWTTDAVAMMITKKDRIGDYKQVTCESGFALSGQDPPSLCYVQNAVAWGLSSASVVLFISTVIAILYWYRIEIQVLLYSKRWCLSLLPRENIDNNKTNQVFLSMAHTDWPFIQSHILSRIEGIYSTVVQERDWTVGENVHSLIHKSIEQSMRSFLVVTPKYLESTWAIEVFRTLHQQATKDKRLRAVVLLVGVKRQHLDKEIQQLLSLARVIHYGERMYWQKIYYALPKDDLINFDIEQAAILNNNKVNKMAAYNKGLQIALNDKGQLINAAFVKDIM